MIYTYIYICMYIYIHTHTYICIFHACSTYLLPNPCLPVNQVPRKSSQFGNPFAVWPFGSAKMDTLDPRMVFRFHGILISDAAGVFGSWGRMFWSGKGSHFSLDRGLASTECPGNTLQMAKNRTFLPIYFIKKVFGLELVYSSVQ